VDPLVGHTLTDRYRLLAHIGKGGMADVYRAEDRAEQRVVALKLLRSSRPELASRLRREYQILTALAHPRIVEVFELGAADRGPFYTMELLDHGDLRSLERPLDVRRACDLLRQVAVALTFLHGRQFIHRDITAGNIRLTADGQLKLIDFGVMITAGSVPEEIAGTPPFLAPESLHGAPIDHRADLFALGALGYWLVTEEHAYPADRIDALPARWAAGPPSLRALRPDLPDELDDLIRSLLRPDEHARPSNAAEVIGRLTGIGDLPPVAADEVARSFISSSAVVGRDNERARLRQLIDDVQDGRGDAVALRGRAGSGKSRLLLELRVAAEVSGVPVARLDGSAAGPGFIDALVAAVERVCPRCRALPSHGALQSIRRPGAARRETEDALGHQLAVQDAVVRWLSELARQQPVVVSIDDGQQLSAHALGVVSAIRRATRTAPVLLVVGHRSDEGGESLRQLELALSHATAIQLAGLPVRAVEALVDTSIGQVPGAKRLASWLHGGTGGNPLLCIEALRSLVDDGALRFADGVWSIDIDLHEHAPPAGLRQHSEERIAGLSPAARDLGSALAVYRGSFDLDEVPDVSTADDPFAALGQLVRAGIFVGGPRRFSFARDDVRRCFVDLLSTERRRKLHRHAAVLLQARPDATALELGWQWLRGGELERGAKLLEQEGRRLHEEQLLFECIAPLQAALDVYDKLRGEEGRALELRSLILESAIMVDRSAFVRNVDRAVADGWQQSGFELVARLQPVLGARLSLLTGVASTFAAWLWRRPSRGWLRPDRALACAMSSLVCGASFSKNFEDPARLERMLNAAKVLDGFRGSTAYAAALMVRSYALASRGEWAEMKRVNDEALALLERRTLIGLTDRERAMAQAEVLNNLAVCRLVRGEPSFEDVLARPQTQDVTSFSVAADALRVCFLRLHAREAEARQLELELESRIARLGSLWIFEGILLEQSAYAYAHYGDLAGLRRVRGSLQQQVEKGARGPDLLHMVTAVCDALIGRHVEAADALWELWAQLPARSARRLPTAVALARSLVWLRRFTELDALLDEALVLARDETSGNPLYACHLTRLAASASRERGALEEADARLEEATALAERLASPGLQALTLETRARIALVRDDPSAAVAALDRMESLTRAAGSPVLLQRCLELADRAEVASSPVAEGVGASADETAIFAHTQTTQSGRSVGSMTDHAVDLARWVLHEAECAEAHVFVVRDGRGEPLASAPEGTPPPCVEHVLEPESAERNTRIHPLPTAHSGPPLGYVVTVAARRPLVPRTLEEVGRRLARAVPPKQRPVGER